MGNESKDDNVNNNEERLRTALDPSYDHCDDCSLFCIGNGPKGRGLFAMKTISPRTLVHIAPCIRIPKKEYERHVQYSIFEHYLFNDGRNNGGDKLLALGYGSLFNHSSSQPNIDYQINSDELEIRYSTGHRQVLQGEELCISYGGNLWFDDASRGGGGEEEQDLASSTSSSEEEEESFLGRIDLH